MLFLSPISDVEALLVFSVGILDSEYVVESASVWLLARRVLTARYCTLAWRSVPSWPERALESLILWDLLGAFSDLLGLREFEGFRRIPVIIAHPKMDDNRVSESDRGGNRRMGGKGCTDISHLLYVSNNSADNLSSKKPTWYLKDGEWSARQPSQWFWLLLNDSPPQYPQWRSLPALC